MFCKNCGNAVEDGQTVCPNCGTEVNVTKEEPAPQPAPEATNTDNLNGKDKMTMGIIAVLIGGFGVHNYMMGENKKGTVRLLFTLLGFGIGSIFGLIDAIMIFMGNYKYDPDKYFF